jgi:hypothetical protein
MNMLNMAIDILMSSSNYDNCKAIADMEDKILGAGMIADGQVAAIYEAKSTSARRRKTQTNVCPSCNIH